MIAASVMKELIISYIIAFKTRTNEHFANSEDPVKKNTAWNYMFKVINRNNRTRSEISSKLTIKTPERHQ